MVLFLEALDLTDVTGKFTVVIFFFAEPIGNFNLVVAATEFRVTAIGVASLISIQPVRRFVFCLGVVPVFKLNSLEVVFIGTASDGKATTFRNVFGQAVAFLRIERRARYHVSVLINLAELAITPSVNIVLAFESASSERTRLQGKQTVEIALAIAQAVRTGRRGIELTWRRAAAGVAAASRKRVAVLTSIVGKPGLWRCSVSLGDEDGCNARRKQL